jgi:hypothetical protein
MFSMRQKTTRTLLNGGQSPFEAVLCQQGLKPVNGKIRPVFYQDRHRVYFIRQDRVENLWGFMFGDGKFFSVYPFYHPFTEVFQQEINRGGVENLYQRNIQLNPQMYANKPGFSFESTYLPINTLRTDAVKTENFDFTRSGAYSIYNWELFFHAPLLIACRLSQNQRFEEAMQWFHYIFDPTNTQLLPTPQRYWITKPFFETSDETYRKERIKYIIGHIAQFNDQLVEWKNNPFKPHHIAQYRTVAYQKTVVMKYLDNLIAWGDQMFRRDTMESINEATLLYVLAHELLGPKPTMIPAPNHDEKTFNEFTADGGLDVFGNTTVEVRLENAFGLPIEYTVTPPGPHEDLPVLEVSYYGLPHNEKLLQYWDTVADRLFKIRHGMNIEGLKRQLTLFEPPIDPALLVKAAAAGLDLSAVLTELNAPAQPYRFQTLAGKAVEFCQDVRSLGQQLLKALESKDAEALALLRTSNGVEILQTMRAIKELKITEIEHTIESFERRKEACQIRIDHIKTLSETLEEEEKAGNWGISATVFKLAGRASNLIASLIAPAPDAEVGANGTGGTPETTARTGGTNYSKVFEYIGMGLDGVAELCKWHQDMLNAKAAGERAKVERESKIAAEQKDIENLELQRLACDIQNQIAQKDLGNFEKEVELRQVELEYLQNKYTNAQLYQWMITQIATIYFQAYQLAFDMAKRAEKSYRRELGLTDSSFIQFGYWDSLKKGLLSADRLNHDVRRMEAAFLDQHKRTLEITKHVSLARLAPRKLLELKTKGRCSLDIEEWMYNLDYPGLYRRRIKSIAITVPCVMDIFTNVNCRLTLHRSEVRVSNLVGAGYAKTGDDDERFVAIQGTGESIATSHCRNDNGMFQLNFDDKRFLPFEDAGAISSWDIALPKDHNQFDFSTMTDFIIHVSYMAQEGGEALAAAAQSQLDGILPDSGAFLVGLKQVFPAEWNTFLNPTAPGSEQKLDVKVLRDFYPYLSRIRNIELSRVGIVIEGKYSGDYVARVTIPEQSPFDSTISIDPSLGLSFYIMIIYIIGRCFCTIL